MVSEKRLRFRMPIYALVAALTTADVASSKMLSASVATDPAAVSIADAATASNNSDGLKLRILCTHQ
jgi:hypothetical protein